MDKVRVAALSWVCAIFALIGLRRIDWAAPLRFKSGLRLHLER